MSERDFETPEARSRIKLTRNAKGDPQWEISVVAGTPEAELDEARRIAVEQWNKLYAELGVFRSAA